MSYKVMYNGFQEELAVFNIYYLPRIAVLFTLAGDKHKEMHTRVWLMYYQHTCPGT